MSSAVHRGTVNFGLLDIYAEKRSAKHRWISGAVNNGIGASSKANLFRFIGVPEVLLL